MRTTNFVIFSAAVALLAVGTTHPAIAQASPPSATGPSAADQQPGMAERGMMPGMGQGMMQPGMMRAMPMSSRHPAMLKIMFAIADADSDGGLSFEEVSAIHKRVFDAIDGNKDGKVMPDELRQFMTE